MSTWYKSQVTYTQTVLGISAALLICTSACAGKSSSTPVKVHPRPSAKRLNQATAVENVVISMDVRRSGRSLIVEVKGLGRGHKQNGRMESSGLWSITASHNQAPLRQILAGPAKVSRDPAGAALGDQWDVEVKFLVAFELPSSAQKVVVSALEPGGVTYTKKVTLKLDQKSLSLRD